MKTLTKLTSRELTLTIQNYLLNNLDFNDYLGCCGIEKLPETTQEKLQAFKQVVMAEYGYNFNQNHNKAYQAVLTDYLQGLPSCLTIHFYNNDIINQLIKWNVASENMTDEQYHDLCDQWWRVMGAKLKMLLSNHNIQLGE